MTDPIAQPTSAAPDAGSTLSAVLRVAAVIGIIVVAVVALGQAMRFLDSLDTSQAAMLKWGTVALLICAYALLLAVPFVPGVEIGLALLIALGPGIIPWVYAATVFGLCLAFLLGWWSELATLERVLRQLKLRRAADRIRTLAKTERSERLEMLSPALARPHSGWIRRMRYLFVAGLLNLPGNSVVGGGGGIMLLAGMSGLFRPVPTAATVALAVSPVPLAVWWFGTSILGA